MDDWLDPNADEHRNEQLAKGVEFAKLYNVFVDSERGRALLDHWDKTVFRKVTPVEAPVQQYAADNAMREFIGGIHHQIELAKEHD